MMLAARLSSELGYAPLIDTARLAELHTLAQKIKNIFHYFHHRRAVYIFRVFKFLESFNEVNTCHSAFIFKNPYRE